jgi:proline iminopeptidase
MKKAILILVVVLLIGAIGGGIWFWNAMQQPLYEPGMVRKNSQASLVPPTQSADQDYWLVEKDIRLFHFADGNGTNVLFVHGGPGFPTAEPLAGLKSLTNNYRIHYYDQRGCGKSSRPIERFASSNYYENMQTLDRTLGLGAQIADIERIRQILGDEKIILIGHSFGGFIASLYATEFPEHVKALILVAPAEMLVMPPESGGLYEQVKPLLPENLKPKYDDYLKRYFDFGNIFSKSDAELAALNREFVPYYEAAMKAKGLVIPPSNMPTDNGGWMVQAMFFSMGAKHDYRAVLKSVNAPVLVIHGDKDLQPEKASRMYAELFPNAEFRVIANAGHFVFSDHPEAFAQAVREFLQVQVR